MAGKRLVVLKAEAIANTVRSLDHAVSNMLSWFQPGGSCCVPPKRTTEDFCANPACQRRAAWAAEEWAREAAHYGRRLLDIAKDYQ